MCIELNQFEEANGLLDALIDEYQHEVEFEDNHMRFSEAEKLPEDGDDEEEDDGANDSDGLTVRRRGESDLEEKEEQSGEEEKDVHFD